MHLRPPSLSLLAAALCALPAASVLFNRPALQYHQAEERYTHGDPEEQRLFEKHWWPLAPPPGHHPSGKPTWIEMKALPALVDKYNKYWRSLPRYPNSSPLLRQAELAPYLPADWRRAERSPYNLPYMEVRNRSNGSNRSTAAELFITEHHKMGVELVDSIRRALRNEMPPHAQMFEALPAWCPPRDVKLIQMVRRPVDAILSGFRYHQNQWAEEIYSWGHRKKQDPQCFECSVEDHAAMFDTCGFNCTYFELLNRVDNITGATIEAISQRTPIASMVNTMARCGQREEVLYLSVDLFRADAAGASACLLRFLGLEEGGALQERLLREVQEQKPIHITSGRYDNTAPRAYLQGHSSWGPAFAEIDRVLQNKFHRQAELYGCPEPDFSTEYPRLDAEAPKGAETAAPRPAECGMTDVDTEYPGNDLGRPTSSPDPEDCCEQCAGREDCLAWTWVMDAKMCFLKGNHPRSELSQIWNSNAISGKPTQVNRTIPTITRETGQSLFCWSIMIPRGYEPQLLAMQYRKGVSIFACDEYSVYSNQSIAVAEDLYAQVVLLDTIVENERGQGSLYNLHIFLAVWTKILQDGRTHFHDWTVKVDPDSVFFPDRLRLAVANHTEEAGGVYLSNCKRGSTDAMNGPIEVFSRNGAAAWMSGIDRCFRDMSLAPWRSEDMFIDRCLMNVLNVRRDFEPQLLWEENCRPTSPGFEECRSATVVAFHPQKGEAGYTSCLMGATEAAASQS